MQPEPLPSNTSEIMDYLDSLGITTILHRHAAVFTVAEAQQLRGSISGGHSKNLFLKDRKGNLFLVSTLEDTAVDLKTLHTHVNALGRLSFGSATLLEQTLGVAPGAVSPLGLLNDTGNSCTLILDERLMTQNPLNFHPLDNRYTVSISPADLMLFLKSTGHSPLLLQF